MAMAETPTESENLYLFSVEGADQLALSLDDLLPDANGNVVLFNDAGVTEMSILSERPVVDTGIAGEEAAADIGDVTGMAYYSFDSGPTLYCPMDVHVSIISETV
jgi:hypothetical protein